MLCVMRLTQNQKKQKQKKKQYFSMVMLFEKITLWHALGSQFPYVVLCPFLMTVQTSQGKVPHTHKK